MKTNYFLFILFSLITVGTGFAAAERQLTINDLTDAIEYNLTARFHQCLNSGMPLDACDELARTPLITAAAFNRLEMATTLLDRNADVNKGNGQKETALIAAVQNNHPHMVKLLLECNANAKAKTRDHKTTLQLAKTDTMRTLLLEGMKQQAERAKMLPQPSAFARVKPKKLLKPLSPIKEQTPAEEMDAKELELRRQFAQLRLQNRGAAISTPEKLSLTAPFHALNIEPVTPASSVSRPNSSANQVTGSNDVPSRSSSSASGIIEAASAVGRSQSAAIPQRRLAAPVERTLTKSNSIDQMRNHRTSPIFSFMAGLPQ